MKMTAQDKRAMEIACDCIRNCKRYGIHPAPYFPLIVRMYHALEDAGMIEWSEEVAEDERPHY